MKVNMAKHGLWISVLLLVTSLTCSGATMDKTDKFDWNASESAPRKYVMTIVSGGLSYHDGSGSLYIPDGSDIKHGWGTGVSSHVTGERLKPLPKELRITFFSYTENQFYRAKFDLPYAKILALFQDGYFSPNEGPKGSHVTYQKIVTGVAPGGAVAVWLVGINRTTEVFFGQAEKFEGEWSSITSNTDMSRAEYIQRRIQDANKTPEALEALRKNGVPLGLWASYRTRYPWQPVFSGMTVRNERINVVKYFNGEVDYLNYPLEKDIAASTRAVPSYLNFIWERGKGQSHSYKLTFNETEIFAAFKKLGNDHPPLQLDMRMTPNEAGTLVFSVGLRNAKESIPLKQTGIEIYGGY